MQFLAVSSLFICFGIATAQGISTKPSLGKPCNGQDGQQLQNGSAGDMVWVCNNGHWKQFKLVQPPLGTSEDMPASSCKEVQESYRSSHCNRSPSDGMYWIRYEDECPNHQGQQAANVMQVWCDMTTSNGGWSLVWKHSYLEVSPLTTDMYYFSTHYRPCTDINSGWCNIPYKARFNPSEMMIVAYHNKRVAYAYKGKFNRNIDSHWSGGTILDPQTVTDNCQRNRGVYPAPSNDFNQDSRLLGVAFDKTSPNNPNHNCDTIRKSFSSPLDCRWYDCYLTSSISHQARGVQMTVAIYVR